MSEQVRIFLIDYYAAVRQGLRALLSTEPDMQVVGEAADGQTAVQRVRLTQPDIILMDLMLPGTDSMHIIRTIHREFPQSRILVLTNYADEKHILDAMSAGVQGYMLKDINAARLIRALRQIAAGQHPLHPTVHKVLLGAVQGELNRLQGLLDQFKLDASQAI